MGGSTVSSISFTDNFNKGLKIDRYGHRNDQENQRRMFSDNFQESQEETPFLAYEMNFVPEIKIESDQFEEREGEEGKDDGDELFSSEKNVEEDSSLELGSGKSASEKTAEEEDYPQQINNDTSILEMVQDFLAIETDINGTGEGRYKIYMYRKK